MAAATSSICVVSPCSSRYSQKLIKSEVVVNNGGNRSSVSASPIIKNKSSQLLPIRCRFTRPDRTTPNHGGGWRRSGTAGSLEATVVGAPTSVPVRVAHELLQAGHHYLDVRSEEEFSAGHVRGAINIPYLHRLGSGMTKNTDFIAQMSSRFNKDDEILIGCQSGKRSLMAANDLLAAGYTGVMEIAGGYAAWIQSELPAQV